MADNVNKSINIAINVLNGVTKQAVSIMSAFSKIEVSANKAKIAMSSFNGLTGKITIHKSFDQFAKALKNISNVKTKGLNSALKDLEKFNNIKFPSFTKVNKDLTDHAKRIANLSSAYKSLAKSSKALNFSKLTKEVKSVDAAINKNEKNVKKSKISFAQWGFALGSAASGLSKVGSRMYGVSRGFSAVSKEMNVAMAAFTIGFSALFALKGVVSDLIEFDDALRAAGAVSQATGEDLNNLSNAARKMGEETRYTATDAAKALKFLGMTGLTVSESIATLPTVLNLAAAGNMELAESADIVTNIMVGYGKTVEDLPRIADLMTAAFTNSNTNLKQLGVAMQYVGPIAKSLGQPIEETTQALALLANAGYRGSKAGTTLRTAMTRLIAPTSRMKKVLDDNNISIMRSDGNMRNFSEVVEELRSKSISTSDAITLFGKRAGPGMVSLISQTPEAIKKISDALADAEGTAARTAYEMERGLGGSVRKLKSIWQELSITIGKKIEPYIIEIIDELTISIKRNKAELASAASAILATVSLFAKMASGVLSFISSNALLITSIGIAFTAFKSLSFIFGTTVLVIPKLIAGFNLLSASMYRAAVGTKTVTAGMKLYEVSAKGVVAADAAKQFTLLEKVKFSSIGSSMAGLGASISSFARSLASSIGLMVSAHPVIAALVVAVGALSLVMYTLSENYSQNAVNASILADSSDDLIKSLESEAFSLSKISKILNESADDIVRYEKAEQSLKTAISESSLSLSEKIKLLDLVATGTDGAKKAQEEYEEILQTKKENEITESLKQRVIAHENSIKAIEKHSRITNVLKKATEGLTKAEEYALKLPNVFTPTIMLAKRLALKILGNRINKTKEMTLEEKKYNEGVTSSMKNMIKLGTTSEEYVAILTSLGLKSEKIDTLVKSFNKLKEIQDKVNESTKTGTGLTEEDIEELERAGKEKISLAKELKDQEIRIENETLMEIARLKAMGSISNEQAEMANLQATMDSSQRRVEIARNAFNEINSAAEDSYLSAKDTMIKAEDDAAKARMAILNKLASDEKKLKDEIKKLDDDLYKAKAKLSEDNAALEKKLAVDIEAINKKLTSDLKDLSEEREKSEKDTIDSILQAERDLANAIAGINSSTEDKMRAVRQRGMSDREKDRDNEKAANAKLSEGLLIIAKARESGDTGALARGKAMISQAESLYSGLGNQKDALSGLSEANSALIKADEAGIKIRLDNIAKEDKARTEALDKKKKALEDSAGDATKKIQDDTNLELAKNEKVASDAIDKIIKVEGKAREEDNLTYKQKVENAERIRAKYEEQIEVLKSQKNVIYDVINAQKSASEWDSSDTFTKAKDATNNALESVKEYSKSIDGIKKSVVDLEFTGTSSPTKPLGEKLEEISKKLKDISADVTVNVKFIGDGKKPLSESLNDIKKEIESIEITVSPKVNLAGLETISKALDEIKNTNVSIIISIEKSKLDQAVLAIKEMKNKTVTIITKVIGLDELTKAKKLIDSIDDKTVIIRTKHVDERAGGGFIGGPEQYANGGNVFRRLSNRFISKGSGSKDDVPALLMKGEFVQKVSAVRKYGKDFMARLNAGMIPRSVVDKFASGGHVGHSGKSLGFLSKKKRKEIFELFGDKASNIGKNLNTQNLKTELGENSISKISNSLSDAVSAFAKGGNVDSVVGAFTASGADINKSYNDEILNAKKNGNDQLAEIYKSERDQIQKLTYDLNKELTQLKEDYDEFVFNTTRDYNKEKVENSNSFNKEMDESKTSFNRDNEEDTYNYKQVKEDYKKEKESMMSEMEKELVALFSPGNEFSYESNFVKISEAKKGVEEYIDKIMSLGATLPGSLYETSDKRAHAATTLGSVSDKDKGRAEWINGIGKHNPMRGGIPDFQYFERIIKNRLASDTQIPSQYSDIVSGLHQKMAELEKSIGKKFNLGEKNKTSSWALAEYRDYMKDNSEQEIAKNVSKQKTSKQRKAITGEYEVKINDLDEKLNNDKYKYKDTMNKRASDYNKNISEKKEEYNKNAQENKFNYSEEIKSGTSDYTDKSKELREAYAFNLSEILKNSANDKKKVKDSVNQAIIDAKSNLSSRKVGENNNVKTYEKKKSDGDLIKYLQVSTPYVDDLGTENKKKDLDKGGEYSQLFKEFLKKYNIQGYNVGGFVKSTANSIAGKDSILANLTPEEYVIKAPVVRKFGKGFFDSINNFKIPAFNAGGLVSKVNNNMVGGSEDSIRHIVDLSINSSKTGELTGNEQTVNNFLNDLALAKLRS